MSTIEDPFASPEPLLAFLDKTPEATFLRYHCAGCALTMYLHACGRTEAVAVFDSWREDADDDRSPRHPIPEWAKAVFGRDDADETQERTYARAAARVRAALEPQP